MRTPSVFFSFARCCVLILLFFCCSCSYRARPTTLVIVLMEAQPQTHKATSGICTQTQSWSNDIDYTLFSRLFGGTVGTTNDYADLWKADTSTYPVQWCFYGQSNLNQPGNYGTLGKPVCCLFLFVHCVFVCSPSFVCLYQAAGNYPIARAYVGMTIDPANNLFVFGGVDYVGNYKGVCVFFVCMFFHVCTCCVQEICGFQTNT